MTLASVAITTGFVLPSRGRTCRGHLAVRLFHSRIRTFPPGVEESGSAVCDLHAPAMRQAHEHRMDIVSRLVFKTRRAKRIVPYCCQDLEEAECAWTYLEVLSVKVERYYCGLAWRHLRVGIVGMEYVLPIAIVVLEQIAMSGAIMSD